MAGLRGTAHDIARGGTPGVLVSDRLLALERLAARLANRRWRRAARMAPRTGRSADRAAIVAYLLGDPGNAVRREAAALAAEGHDWAWRQRGRQWRLWEGPDTLAAALRDASAAGGLLREAGLVGRLASGGFATAARAAANGKVSI